jgi:non-specific serine/threonine protein kinase
MQRLNGGVARQYAGEAAQAEAELSSALETSRSAFGWNNPTTESLRYHLADCRLDQHKTAGVKDLVEGLSVVALNEAQIETDWEGRLSYERGRLALYSGDRQRALSLLQAAATSVAKVPFDGRVGEATVLRLIQQAGGAVSH